MEPSKLENKALYNSDMNAQSSSVKQSPSLNAKEKEEIGKNWNVML